MDKQTYETIAKEIGNKTITALNDLEGVRVASVKTRQDVGCLAEYVYIDEISFSNGVVIEFVGGGDNNVFVSVKKIVDIAD